MFSGGHLFLSCLYMLGFIVIACFHALPDFLISKHLGRVGMFNYTVQLMH
jgi:hypothetical protein